MLESLVIEETTTHSVVTASIPGNPFTIRATVGTRDGHFIGASFFIVSRGERIIEAQCHCSDYGVEHAYTGDDADALTALCQRMTADLEEQFVIHFLVRDDPQEEDVMPAEEPAGEPGEPEETIDASEAGNLEDLMNGNSGEGE